MGSSQHQVPASPPLLVQVPASPPLLVQVPASLPLVVQVPASLPLILYYIVIEGKFQYLVVNIFWIKYPQM